MVRNRLPGLTLLLSCSLLAAPSRAGVLESIFANDFDSGALGGWSDAVASVCPFIAPVPDQSSAVMFQETAGAHQFAYYGDEGVTMDNIEQELAVEIYEDFGGPITPDTIDLGSGDEVNYASCGSCVLLYRDTDPGPNTTYQYFFQRSGSLDIDTLNPTVGGAFEGTVSAVLEEVTIDPSTFESTPVPNGCWTEVLDYPFSEIFVADALRVKSGPIR